MLRAICALLLAGACAHPAPAAPASAGSRAERAALESPPGSSWAREPEPRATPHDGDEVETAPPGVAPPSDVVCMLAESQPSDACGPKTVDVHLEGHPQRPLARVDGGAVVTWGLRARGGSGWVRAEAGGLVVTGDADPLEHTFYLDRDVPLVPFRVWLRSGASVGVKRAVDEGVSVKVEGDVRGVSTVPAVVPCEALAFRPPAPVVARPRRAARGGLHARPNGSALVLHAAPAGDPLTTLFDPEGLSLDLEIAERLGDWSRVHFETRKARFDVWVPSRSIRQSWFGSSGGLRSTCTSRRPVAPYPATIAADVAVRVGREAAQSVVGGLTARAGAQVTLRERRGDLLSIELPKGGIHPPLGAKFWIPESALEPLSASEEAADAHGGQSSATGNVSR